LRDWPINGDYSMKVGDLVKIKWVTFASMRRAKRNRRPSDEIGLISAIANNACKVVFPLLNSKQHAFVIDDLEVISENQNAC
jgi:hypothetical protein